MLSQSRLKFLRSLQLSKFRSNEKQFLVEGNKIVEECLSRAMSNRFYLEEVFALSDWAETNKAQILSANKPITIVSPAELKKISVMKSPNQVVALISFMSTQPDKIKKKKFYLGLDRIQDPGNVGTIFRIAEWFGVEAIYLSSGSAHPLSPKVIQAAMGSALRVPFHSVDLAKLIQNAPDHFPVIGTLLDGEPLTVVKKPEEGLILIGNESEGLHTTLRSLVSLPVSIERQSKHPVYPESLNAAIATALVLRDFSLNSF